MRPLRKWAYKQIQETPENHFKVAEAMIAEEDEERKAILRDCPGLKEYLEAGKTPQDFINEYGTLNWNLRYCQFTLVWEEYVRETHPYSKDDTDDWHKGLEIIQDNINSIVIPKDLAWRLYSPEIPEKYKTWGFAIYFSDNDFSGYMEILGKLIGDTYLEDLNHIAISRFKYEDLGQETTEEECQARLGKYFDQERLKSLICALYPGACVLGSWEWREELEEESEIIKTRDYLKLNERPIKIGTLEEIRDWMVSELGWTEVYPEKIWCNSECLVVYIKDGKIESCCW